MKDDNQHPDEGLGIRDRFRRREPGPHTLKLLMVPLVGFVIASNVGDAFMPTLVENHPLVLLALNARIRNLVLVTNQIDAVPYYVVGTVRLLASDPLFYLLGWYYGDRAVEWIEERHDGIGRFVRSIEQVFSRAAYPLVAIAPNNFICLFAGSAGMSLAAFVGLNAAGTILRLWLARIFGEAFSDPIDSVLNFIAEYRPYILAMTIGFVVISSVRQARSGTGEIGEILHLEEDLEENLDADPDADPDADRDDGQADGAENDHGDGFEAQTDGRRSS